jgi:DNA-directed RNA polymerase subunit RPC12/RpoP
MAINTTLRFTLAELTRTVIDLEEVRDALTADIAKIQTRIDQIREALRAPTPREIELPQPDYLSRCPTCGGPADNGYDRELPPDPYICSKCATAIEDGAKPF